jgi:hypothetical protein
MEFVKKIIAENPRLKKLLGVFLVILGLMIHLIPFVPASWIIVIGLELLGVRLLLQNKAKAKWHKFKSSFKNLFS